MAAAAQTTTFLAPIERPGSLFMKLGYYFMRKRFGKVMTPAAVFSARVPTAFTTFYGKIGKLDRKLAIQPALVLLLREYVAMTNGCEFCMDATKAAAFEKDSDTAAKIGELSTYPTSVLFTEAERAALNYAGELTAEHAVAPETIAALKRHFSDRKICDIVWVVASEHLYNLTNVGLNIGSDGFCEIAAAKRRHK
jgi:alkylhydroperoxidase family enzyme